jgi:hypothetical protein
VEAFGEAFSSVDEFQLKGPASGGQLYASIDRRYAGYLALPIQLAEQPKRVPGIDLNEPQMLFPPRASFLSWSRRLLICSCDTTLDSTPISDKVGW